MSADTLIPLTRLRNATLLKIPGVGRTYASVIQGWQPHAQWSSEVEWVEDMIQDDARRALELEEQITTLETTMHHAAQESTIATM